MREVAGPSAPSTDVRNVPELLARRAAQAPDHAAFDVPRGEAWEQVTTRQFEDRVIEVARGLVGAGIEPGDAVAVMGATSYEWGLVDMAALYAGAIVVPIYDSSAREQVRAILKDADVRLAIVDTEAKARMLEDAAAEAGHDYFGTWMMADGAGGLDALRDLGREVTAEQVRARAEARGPEDIATIVYTSGTTSHPKGVLITHGDFAQKVESVGVAYPEIVDESGNTVLFLPLAHVLARCVQVWCLSTGMRIAHVGKPKEAVPALAELRPTFLMTVPYVLTKILAAAGDAARSKRMGWLWRQAQSTAIQYGRLVERGDQAHASKALRARYRFFDRLFYSRLRAKLGGRVKYMLSGAARLPAEVALFFTGAGVSIIEGYGLTESTAPATGQRPGRIRAGTVGLPLPGVTVRISDEGEVLIKGCGVTSGYRNPDFNEAAFVDGFFRTGDLGHLDDEGNLCLTGRRSELIVTSTGKTVSPTDWEHDIEESALISHAMVVGDDRPFLTALLVLDPEQAALGEAEQAAVGGVHVVRNVDLQKVAQGLVDGANAKRSRPEQVRQFAMLLADLTPQTGILTPTQKLKRPALLERAKEAVEELYARKVGGSSTDRSKGAGPQDGAAPKADA